MIPLPAFIQPFLQHAFLQQALLAGLLAAIPCGVVGSYVVIRRISYIAGGIAHSVLGGMGARAETYQILEGTLTSAETGTTQALTGAFEASLFGPGSIATPELTPLLVDDFLRTFNKQYNKDMKQLSPETMQVFMKYHWPGNVRELQNLVKRMVVLANEQAVLDEIAYREAPKSADDEIHQLLGTDGMEVDVSNGKGVDLKAISKRAAQVAEKRVIERVLQQTRWNRKEAAQRLQISYKALLYKMKENGLSEGR